jgi:hypothetical protein
MQNVMWRFSLSNSDATSMMAMFLAIFAMYIAEKKLAEARKEINDAKENVDKRIEKIAKEWGIDKDKIKVIIESVSKIDAKNLEKLINNGVERINRAKSFDDMEKDFDNWSDKDVAQTGQEE